MSPGLGGACHEPGSFEEAVSAVFSIGAQEPPAPFSSLVGINTEKETKFSLDLLHPQITTLTFQHTAF